MIIYSKLYIINDFILQNRGRYSMPTTPTPMDKANYGVMRRAIPAHIGKRYYALKKSD